MKETTPSHLMFKIQILKYKQTEQKKKMASLVERKPKLSVKGSGLITPTSSRNNSPSRKNKKGGDVESAFMTDGGAQLNACKH